MHNFWIYSLWSSDESNHMKPYRDASRLWQLEVKGKANNKDQAIKLEISSKEDGDHSHRNMTSHCLMIKI